MRWPVWLLLLIVFLACTGCVPIGDIGGSGDGTDHDELLAVPYRIVYNVNQRFIRDTDLAVFISHYGILEIVSINKVNISIEDPVGSDPYKIDVDEFYPLLSVGRKIIIVSYQNYASVRYSIEVQDPFGIGPPPNPDLDPEDENVREAIITWKYPKK